MKGEVFVGMINNHAKVINAQGDTMNAQGAKITTHQQALAYISTRQKAEEQVKTAGRFSMLWTPLREVFIPGSFKAAVDAAQKALLAPPAPVKAAESKIDIKPVQEPGK